MAGVSATYYGQYVRGYLQYIDLSNYHTLVAEPRNTYQIAVASGWGGQLAAVPADGLWGGPGQFPAGFSGVPGFASPGAFILGSPGTAHQADRAMLSALEVLSPAQAPELRDRQEQAEEQRLRDAGWTAGDLRRWRQRRAIARAWAPMPAGNGGGRAASAAGLAQAREREHAQQAEQARRQRLWEAGWSAEERALHGRGWTAADIRRRRQRVAVAQTRARMQAGEI